MQECTPFRRVRLQRRETRKIPSQEPYNPRNFPRIVVSSCVVLAVNLLNRILNRNSPFGGPYESTEAVGSSAEPDAA